MAKDPAFLFYSADFLIGTIGMSNEEVGQYIRLLCMQHQKGHLSEEMVKEIVPNWSDAYALLCKFTVDKKKCIFNERLEEEIKKREEYKKSRASNALRGWEMRRMVKKDSLNAHAMHMQSTSNAYGMHSVNENINTILSNKCEDKQGGAGGGNGADCFEKFWEVYPRKQKEILAQQAWCEITELQAPAELLSKCLAALEWQVRSDDWKRDKGKWIPIPSSYLRNGQYNDKPIVLPKEDIEDRLKRIKNDN
jgi:uncharacterized protein YdaU (DUF1376 family)